MGFNESLTTNGNYTITNLKAATGIADDRLSAHHPNGAGNETALGDFSIRALGHELSAGDLTRLLRPVQVTVNGSVQSISGSYDTQNPPFFDFSGVTLDPRNPDKFTIRIDLPPGQRGQHAIQQILKNGNGLTADVESNAKLIGRTVNTNSIDLQYEVTGFINLQVGVTFDDGMNVNAENVGKASSDKEGNNLPENAGFAFRTEDVLDPVPKIEQMQVGIQSDGASPETISFDINVDGNNQNIGEGTVVFDPANKIDGDFLIYQNDPSSNPEFVSGTQPDFLATNHFELRRSTFSNGPNGNREIEYFLELQDQSGTVRDVVSITINEGDTGTWSTTNQQYKYTAPESRATGTRSSPFAMNFDSQV